LGAGEHTLILRPFKTFLPRILTTHVPWSSKCNLWVCFTFSFADISDEFRKFCCFPLRKLYVFYFIFHLLSLYLFNYYFSVKRNLSQSPQRLLMIKRRTLLLWEQGYMQVERGKTYQIITPTLKQCSPILNITWSDVRSLKLPFICTK